MVIVYVFGYKWASQLGYAFRYVAAGNINVGQWDITGSVSGVGSNVCICGEGNISGVYVCVLTFGVCVCVCVCVHILYLYLYLKPYI